MAVYGTLAVVCVLVLWQRGAFAGDSPHARELRGRTGEGSPVLVHATGESVTGFDIASIHSRCTGGRRWSTRWYPSVNQSNVSYRRIGPAFEIHEWPRPGLLPNANLYMRGRLTASGVTGMVWYRASWPSGVRCESIGVPFAAHP